MKIGIVGVGMVGGTLKFGFERLGHDVRCYDVAVQRTKLSDVLDTDLAFISVPTPGRPDGSCDTSIVSIWGNSLGDDALLFFGKLTA